MCTEKVEVKMNYTSFFIIKYCYTLLYRVQAVAPSVC